MAEATSLIGFFIEAGTIVQVRDAAPAYSINTIRTTASPTSARWRSLINRDRPPRHEHFRRAIKDYGRGLNRR
jgi:hypothetical protein